MKRIHQIDTATDGFIYMVSSASVTGSKSGFGEEQEKYFSRIASLNLANPSNCRFWNQGCRNFSGSNQKCEGCDNWISLYQAPYFRRNKTN